MGPKQRYPKCRGLIIGRSILYVLILWSMIWCILSKALPRRKSFDNDIPGCQLQDKFHKVDHLPSSFQRCLYTHQNISATIAVRKAPFAVVQAKDSMSTGKDFDLATSAVRCYARYHGGLHFVDVFNSEQYSGRHFFRSRWISLRDRYWDEADWLLAADGDFVPAGFHRSVMELLNNVEDADIVLHARENYEVTAYLVIFRTGSNFAKCFLQEWIEEGHEDPMPNFDNGDLLRLVLRILAPDLHEECDHFRDDYTAYVICFSKVYIRIVNGNIPKVPVKVFFPLEGMTRCYEGDHNKEWSMYEWATSCLSGDIFLHGLKSIGEVFYEPDTYSCQRYPDLPLPRKCYDQKMALNDSATLSLAQKCCFWHYAGCYDDSRSNICRDQPHCQRSLGGRSGMGICTHSHLAQL